MTEAKMSTRVRILAGFVALLFAALLTRLWFLQVLAAEEYQVRAESNRVRVVHLPALRGEIRDREGRVIIGNRRSTQVVVNRRNVENPEDLLYRLSEVLEEPVEKLTRRYNDPTYLPHQPVPIADGVSQEKVTFIMERSREFPGVAYRTVGVREHEHGLLAAHVIGYLGEISQEELDDESFRGYRPGDEVGRGGVEQQYERHLRGRQGLVSLQVDAQGRVGDVLGRKDPEPGNDLYLSLDIGLQKAVESSLRQGVRAASGVWTDDGRVLNAKAGVVVAMDPRNGQVLAMASFPTFDPTVFQGGISQKEWRHLTAKSNNYPLNNRAVQGQYPAASTLKPFMAAAGVRTGLVDAEGYYPCPPTFEVPGDTSETVFNNWTPQDLGHLSLAESLSVSCDIVYYQMGLDFYRQRHQRGELMQRQLRRWGFGRPTGVDIPSEAAGRIPDRAWKEAVHDAAPKLFPQPLWLPGDNINMSIGQGDLLVTPLQLTSAYAAIANGGTLYRPSIGLRVEAPDGEVLERIAPEPIGEAPLPNRARKVIFDGLKAAVTSGTAASAFAGFPHSEIPIAGKTGTAEVIVEGQDANHSLFAAMAPADDPEIVVLAVVEEGGHGSQVAAPIVRRVLEQYFGLTPSEISIAAATD